MNMMDTIKQNALSHVIIAILAAVVGCVSTVFFQADNPLEQTAESVIQKELGIDVDLSPTSTKD